MDSFVYLNEKLIYFPKNINLLNTDNGFLILCPGSKNQNLV